MTYKAIMKKEKNKKRGRNKISAKLRRKQKNVVDAQTIKLKVGGIVHEYLFINFTVLFSTPLIVCSDIFMLLIWIIMIHANLWLPILTYLIK